MALVDGLCQEIIKQIFELLVENEKKLEIKKRLIDPLIDYYKRQLFIFYGLITFLLLVVIITNFYIIYVLMSS